MKKKYICDSCELPTDIIHDVYDEAFCQDCLERAIHNAEMRDAYWEDYVQD